MNEFFIKKDIIFEFTTLRQCSFECCHKVSRTYPANICLFKVNNRNIRKRCEIRPKLTIKTPERRQ